MQKEWAAGVSQWVAHREVERVNRRFRNALGLDRDHSTDEWRELHQELQDRALLAKATKWLRHSKTGKTRSIAKRRMVATVRESVERNATLRGLRISQNQDARKKQAPKAKPERERQASADHLATEATGEEPSPADTPEEAAEALQVYLSKDGNQYGPHTIEELQALLDDGQLVAEDMAFYEGREDWVTVAEVPGLRIRAETTGDTEPEVAPEEDLETATREPAKEAKTEERKNGVRPILALVPLVMLLLGMGGVTVYLLNHVNELEERLSGRLDKWDEDLAFLQEIPEPEEETQGPGETGQTGSPSTPATPVENTTEPKPPPAPPAPKPKPEPAKPDNPNLNKLKSACSLVIKSLETISAKVGAREFEDEAVKTEQKTLLSLLEEFVSHATIIETGASVNGATVVQNLKEVIRVSAFLKKTQSEVSKKSPDSVKTIRELATKLTPYKQSLQSRAGSLVDGLFADYPKGEHVRTWTDKAGNNIRGYLWGYAPEADSGMVLVEQGEKDPVVLRPPLSGMKFSNADRGYLNAFLAWRESMLATYRDKEPDTVLIKKGTFMMGSSALEKGAKADERPQHEVTISYDFHMRRYEVTVGEWLVVMGATYQNKYYNRRYPFRVMGPFAFSSEGYGKHFEDYPASWVDVQYVHEYCEKLTAREHKLGRLPAGMVYRLPTEAEWEYALRAGTKTPYFWGTDQRKSSAYQKLVNPWGLHDMIGSVNEFLLDLPRKYTAEPEVDPLGKIPGKTSDHAWRITHYNDANGRSAHRGGRDDNIDSSLGFRLVRAKPIKK